MDTLEVIYSEFLSHTNNCSLLTLVGLVTTILCLITLTRVLVWTPFKLYFLAQVLPGVDLKKLGKWAVITGATGGIGKGYCKVLAEKGMNIVLISRSSEKLAKEAEEIREAYGVVVRTLTADFHSTDIYERIEEELRELDVGVLVNNVGTSNVTATFLKTTNILQTTTDILHVNCVSMTNMCAIVLPQMLHKDKGVIINISSIGRIGFLGAPVYSSSKSYVSKLSECLQRTYRNSGVIIQTLEPGMVLTELLENGMRLNSSQSPQVLQVAKKYTSVTADYYARCAVNTIGWADVSNGCFVHYLVYILALISPQKSSDERLLADLEKN